MVFEVYFLYDCVYLIKEVYNKFKGYDVSFLWNVIEIERNINEIVYIEFFGYSGKDLKFLVVFNIKGKLNGD